MKLSAQRANIVLEHASAATELDDQNHDNDNSWSVVAYLVFDSGERHRVTLRRCKTRVEASEALVTLWHDLTEGRSFLAGAA